MKDPWPAHYPPSELVRGEVEACIEAFLKVLFEKFSKDEITGIYWKGSSYKHWDSVIDYVPEMSDVDIHVYFANPAEAKKRLGNTRESLAFSKRLEEEFTKRVPSPYHTPALQFLIGTDVESLPIYLPAPKSTVHTLYGEPYQDRRGDQDKAERTARQQLDDYKEFLEALPLELMGTYRDGLGPLLVQFFNRLGQAAPRSLVSMGVTHYDVMSMNRTEIVHALKERGEHVLAEHYENFYVHAWEFFASGKKDYDAARNAIQDGIAVLRRGIELAHEQNPRKTAKNGSKS